jgi:protocatechuate 4,5-dioxygenase beta chain
MGKIVGGIGLSHVPSVGPVVDRNRTQEPAWKPLFDAYVPVREWLAKLKPDVAIVVYNDHAADFSFDKYPTFALGVADRYPIGDEGFGTRPLPEVKGDLDLSIHLSETLVYEHEFDLTLCQEIAVEHGFLVPMNLCFPHGKDAWPVRAIPLQVNVVQHPLPTARRCFALGKAIRAAVEAYPANARVVIMGTGGMSHQLQAQRAGLINVDFDLAFLDRLVADPDGAAAIPHVEYLREAGSEGIELVMWLVMRGALPAQVREVHRATHVPTSNTHNGLLVLEPA